MATPTKNHPQGVRSNASDKFKNHHENSNPNLTSPPLKPSSSPSLKPSRSPISSLKGVKNPCFVSKIRDRKFVVAKKKNNPKKQQQLISHPNCKCIDKINGKCLCVAYDNLRASQEDFFKGQHSENLPIADTFGDVNSETPGEYVPQECESPNGLGSSTIKRTRDILMEEAKASVPDPGSGRVFHLVKAFERLLTMPKVSESDDQKQDEDTKKGLKWALPGLQQHPPRAPATEDSSSAFCPGDLFFNAQSLGLDAPVSSSLDSSRGSVSSRGSTRSQRSQRSRRSGSFSSETVGGKKWKKQQQRKRTSLIPFRLRTERRGKMKEEEFVKKLHEMMIEEEKQRIPIAQGLPWTTDEPESLIKPPIKECTKPIDLKLHSDIRAVERAEFDHQVTEKLMLIKQYKMERERQQKLEEEEEIRRLRKELVPKAQPMPYFDRPFIPRRSEKQPTIPKEPKSHFPQQKKIKCCLSWNDLNDYAHAAS